ncbi:MAG: hypothetical protein GX596_03145 [Propionibacterium sp.]|nr:hypothetical protein [Propionibacterium sp.]
MNQNSRSAGVSTVGFVLIVLAIVGLGLGGVMVVTTSIGAQSRELTSLQRQADELGYESAALTSQLDAMSSTASLALRATDLGMVPNPYPAYVSLADGEILGDPTPVTGDELPQLSGKLPPVEESPEPEPEPLTTPSPTPPVDDEAGDEPDTSDSDVVAAAAPGGQG